LDTSWGGWGSQGRSLKRPPRQRSSRLGGPPRALPEPLREASARVVLGASSASRGAPVEGITKNY